MKKIGRNDVCHCGSGRKFKNCCMDSHSGVTAPVTAVDSGNHGHQSAEDTVANHGMTSRLGTVPDPHAVLYEMAIKHHQNGQLEQAEAIYQSLLQLPDGLSASSSISSSPPGGCSTIRPDALHYLGVIAYQKGDLVRAAELIRLAIAENPANAIYFSNLGMVLRDQRQFHEAVQHHRRAIALNPDYPEAYTNLGVALTDLGEYQAGIACYQKAIGLRPEYVEALDNLGTAQRQAGKFAESLASHQRVLELNPHYLVAYTNMAATFIEIERLTEATDQCMQVIDIDPGYVEAYLLLSKICLLMGHMEESLQFIRHALALDPNNVNMNNILFNLGILFLSIGNLEEGWKGYEYRWLKETEPVSRRVYSYPHWQGESLADKLLGGAVLIIILALCALL